MQLATKFRQISPYFLRVSHDIIFSQHYLCTAVVADPSLPPSSVLSGQVPADADEPFFILSLTEIPVGSLGEMGDSTSEPLPLLPVTELSQQQQRFGHHLHMPGLCLPFLILYCFLSPLVFQENVWTSRSLTSSSPRKRAASSQWEISP